MKKDAELQLMRKSKREYLQIMKAGKLENINKKKTELTGKKPLKIREMKIIQLDEFYEKKTKIRENFLTNF